MSIAVIENPAAAADTHLDVAAGVPPAAQDKASAIAAALAGTPTRYTRPTCQDYPAKCSHAANYHVPSKPDLNETLRSFGLTRRADGSAHLTPVAPPRPPRAGATVPARTRENIAACAAVGLSFWSAAPTPNGLWAVDDHQRAHLVKVDRSTNRAYVACMDEHSLAAAAHTCHYQGSGDQQYTVPSANSELATLMQPTLLSTEDAA